MDPLCKPCFFAHRCSDISSVPKGPPNFLCFLTFFDSKILPLVCQDCLFGLFCRVEAFVWFFCFYGFVFLGPETLFNFFFWTQELVLRGSSSGGGSWGTHRDCWFRRMVSLGVFFCGGIFFVGLWFLVVFSKGTFFFPFGGFDKRSTHGFLPPQGGIDFGVSGYFQSPRQLCFFCGGSFVWVSR